jgi:hypothetical protein
MSGATGRCRRPPSAARRWRCLVREVFDADLAHQGVHAGVELVRSIMRDLGLVACQPRPYRATTLPDAAAAGTADLVAGDFTADAPGAKLVGSGGRGESHPPAPTEPCVTVSRHTAPTIQLAGTLSSTPSARTDRSHGW